MWFRDHRMEILRFHLHRFKRMRRHKRLRRGLPPRLGGLLEPLREEGCAVVQEALPKGLLLALRDEMETLLASGRCLQKISKDSARIQGDTHGPSVFLTREELAHGQEFYSHHTNHVSIEDPLVNCPSSVRIAFDETLIQCASEYLGCMPAIGSVNLRKSFANPLSDFDTHYFHSDENSPRFLKFFFYLNDVSGDGGPFCYVRGSHRRKFRGWRSCYRWTPEEVATQYGEERIVELCARVGDLIVADTTGFHRGCKARLYDRRMFTVNFVVHREYWGKTPPFRIARRDYERFSERQKAAADFLEVV